MKYFLLPAASGLLLLLCGCPAQQPGAPAGVSPHATAPTLGGGNAAATEQKNAGAAASSPATEDHAQQDQTLIAASKQAYDTGLSLYQAG